MKIALIVLNCITVFACCMSLYYSCKTGKILKRMIKNTQNGGENEK